MKIDWKARFRNKTFILSLTSAVVPFVYQILGILGVVSPISQETVVQWIGLVLNLLVGLGVIINPTTDGISD